MSYQFTINKPLAPNNLPSEEVVIASAKELIDTAPTWKEGKKYHKNTVRTFSRPKGDGDGAPWYARLSVHSQDEITFDEFWGKLGKNKAETEKEFIADIKKVTEIKNISSTQAIWSMYYTFTPPVSPRVFTVLQITYLDETSPRTGLIVSIPVDVTGDSELAVLEEKAVKGKYVSIERIREIDNGKVEWLMATSSSAGGYIPKFLAEGSMPGKISDDVPHFLHWFHKAHPRPTAATTQTDKDDAAAHAFENTIESTTENATVGGGELTQLPGGAGGAGHVGAI